MGYFTNAKRDQVDKLRDAVASIDKSGISHKALVVLLADATNQPKDVVKKVLEGVVRIQQEYLR